MNTNMILKGNASNVTQGTLDSLQVDLDTYTTLKNSIYPGGKDESIKMALAYCRTAQLDILQKPVHIVPMSVQNPVTKAYEWRDIVMPGIALYRIQASRAGSYAGKESPVYGPDTTETICGTQVTYPQWCQVTVKKIIQGVVCEFTAKEFWKENFASKKGGEPNAMWLKRPYAQLAKCTEAQALRMAFPELVGGMPTAEEMEGKTVEGLCDVVNHGKISRDEVVNEDEIRMLRDKMIEAEQDEITICGFLKIESLEIMSRLNFAHVMRKLQATVDKNRKVNDLAINKMLEEDEKVDISL